MEILKYAIGIDIAKEKFDVCISNIDQLQHVSIRAQCNFANTAKGFERFFSWATKHTNPDIPCIFLMEATGIYYEQLAWFLHNKNCRIAVVLPNKAKKYKEALGLKSKNDRIDAKGLAQMACEQNNTEWKPLSSNIYLLRLIMDITHHSLPLISEQSLPVFQSKVYHCEPGMRKLFQSKVYQ